MVSAIGSSPASSVASTVAASTAGVEAELARYRKELADCVSCESANTKQGKADIQELSNKIKIAEARIDNTTTSKPATQPAASNTQAVSNAPTHSNAAASIAESESSDEFIAKLKSSDSIIGNFVDVFA